VLRYLSLFAALALLWLLLSGHYSLEEPLIASLGLASCLFAVWVARRMDVVDAEAVPYELGGGILAYWIWLFREIAKSNIAVTRAVFSDLAEVRPRVVRLASTQKGELARVIYANSITLTPGTVTLAIDGKEFLVHALTESAADIDGLMEMDRRVSRLER